MKIGRKQIGVGRPVFVIAEAGVNHNNKLSLAYKMIDIASKSGADAIKFQTFLADNIQLKNSTKPNYQKSIKGNYYKIIKNNIKSIHGMSKINWMRYGHHLFEGIAIIWGIDIKYVRCLTINQDHDIIIISYNNNLNVTLEFINEISLPIYFKCFSTENNQEYVVPFIDYYSSFRKMMLEFAKMVECGYKPIKFDEIINISKVILAGDISKKMDGIKICPKSLKPI